MKTVKVAAAIICDDMEHITQVFATARGYGEYRGQWEFPGGKAEPGETTAQALEREIMEELETRIEVGRFLTCVEYDYPSFHLSMDCYLCRIVEGNLVLKEAADARWLRQEELDEVAWLPADQIILPLLRNCFAGNTVSADE